MAIIYIIFTVKRRKNIAVSLILKNITAQKNLNKYFDKAAIKKIIFL